MPVRSALVLSLLLGCQPKIVELVPGSQRDAASADTGAPDTGVQDTGASDTGAPDTGLLDGGLGDAGVDAGPDDTGVSGDAGFTCVCRYTSCGGDPDCAVVGPRSTCARGTCSGATGSCRTSADCGNGWTCTLGETSLDPCP